MSGSRLPKAYSAFAPVFAQMDPALSQVLNGILSALSSRADAAAFHEQHPSGEFIGYDGIEHRGKLSNLLETEWLLRELDPDDFVRRIAEGEVLYRRRDFADPGKRNTLAVIVDCGPWMLGRNRLIALAALFYLALRAERLGSDLHWIIPGGGDGATWTEGLTRETIKGYLGKIVQGEIRTNGIDRVLEQLNPEGRLDCWYVGARETAAITEHPAIDASFLVSTLYETDEPSAEIEISAGRGRMTRVTVAFPNDDTCIAALRRPFKPESKKAVLSGAIGETDELSRLPYPTHWMLDRDNKAVLIRFAEGMLWQPLAPAQLSEAVWFPVGDKRRLLGVQVKSQRQLIIAIAEQADEGYSLAATGVSLLAHVEGAAESDVIWGSLPFDPGDPDAAGLPVLRSETVDITSGDKKVGTAEKFIFTERDGHVTEIHGHPDHGEASVGAKVNVSMLHIDANYRVVLSENDGQALTVYSRSRLMPMMDVALRDDLIGIRSAARKVLFSPTAKLIAITTDGARYSVIGTEDDTELTMPDGWELLNLNTPRKGVAWNAEEGALVRFSFLGREMHRSELIERIGPGIRRVQYCPLTSTAFGMEFEESGAPKRFVPILSKRNWSDVEPIDLTEAVVNARTVRISVE